MKSTDLLKFESVVYWLEGLSENTTRKYLEYFKPFVTHVKMNPDEIIAQRKEDLRSEDMQIRKRFEHIAKNWYHDIYDRFEQEGKSTGHAYNFLKTVQSFFSRNDLPLRFKRKELKKVKKKIKRLHIDIEDLKTSYTMLDVRDKAIFTTLLQSGLSEIDLCSLRIEDIIKDLDNPPVYLEGYREKTTTRYQTCIGEDACVAVQKYLLLRGNPTEGLLFTTKFDEAMTPRAIRDALKPVEKVIPDFNPKMLRDVFHDALQRAGITRDLSSRMFGHTMGASGEYLFSPHTVKSAYAKVYIHLKIDNVTRATSRDKSIAELILRLGEVVSVIATEGQQQGILALTGLINELKGVETTPEATETYARMKSSEQIRKEFNEALKTYLSAL